MNKFFENPFETRKDEPAEVPVHRKVLLEDKDISPKHRRHSINCVRNTTTSSQKTAAT